MLDLSKTEAIWLERMLDRKNMATSYKAFWLKAILEEVQESDLSIISFDRLVCRMIVEAWYPLVQYRLNFGIQDKLQRIVDYLELKYSYGPMISKSALLNTLYHSDEISQDKEFQKLKKEFYDMVPYRLINPFFSDQTKGLKDQKKNRLITMLSKEDDNCVYKINTEDRSNKTIVIQDQWLLYLKDNYSVVKGWLENKLVIYLQHKNPSVPSIPLKLEPRRSRDLGRAKKYWKAYNLARPIEDIYTSIKMNESGYTEKGAFSLDHFVPWSFVMHDDLWNIIPTFKDVNSAKNNRLPDLDRYLTEYCLIHYDAFDYMKQNVENRKYLQDYLNVGGQLNSEEILNQDVQVGKEVFVEALKQAILPIYQIAHNQGFEIWER